MPLHLSQSINQKYKWHKIKYYIFLKWGLYLSNIPWIQKIQSMSFSPSQQPESGFSGYLGSRSHSNPQPSLPVPEPWYCHAVFHQSVFDLPKTPYCITNVSKMVISSRRLWTSTILSCSIIPLNGLWLFWVIF